MVGGPKHGGMEKTVDRDRPDCKDGDEMGCREGMLSFQEDEARRHYLSTLPLPAVVGFYCREVGFVKCTRTSNAIGSYGYPLLHLGNLEETFCSDVMGWIFSGS